MINTINKKIKEFSKNIFLIEENGKKTSYQDLLKFPSSKLKFLKKGSLVLIIANNSKSFFELYFYFLKKNIVQILVDSNISDHKLNNIIEAYKPNYLFVDINKSIKPLANLNEYKIGEYKILEISSKQIKLNSDLALLLSTSGSTGSSKFVKLSYLNIFDNAKNISRYLGIKKSHVTVTSMPPSYSYGLSIINSHFFSGAKILLNKHSFFEKKFWANITKFKVNSFGGVPYHYEMLKKLKFHNLKLPDLRYLTQAGGPLKIDLIKYYIETCSKKKINFIQMYGQTEASPRMSYLKFNQAKKKIGSIGKEIPGGKMFLLKKNKNSGIGELCYKGKNIFIGYSQNFKDLKNKKKISVLRTGDLAKVDEQGFFYVTGRKDKIVKVAGNRINLEELSKITKSKGIHCEFLYKSNKIKIFSKSLDKNILDTICLNTGLKKNFIELIKINKFPLNNRGKIDFSKLKEYENNTRIS